MTTKQNKKNLSMGLETLAGQNVNNAANAVKKAEVETNEFAFENLKSMNPFDYLDKQYVSSKFIKGGGVERELKVKQGLEQIEKMFDDPSGLIMLMANWWEVKPARNVIKEKLEQYCEENGLDETEFLQETVRNEVNKLKELKSGIERLSYLVTYYKPRTTVSRAKGKLMNIIVNGQTMNIHKNVFERIKAEFGSNKEAFKAEVLKVAQPIENLIEL